MKNRFQIILTTVVAICLSFQLAICQTTIKVKKGDYYKTWITPIEDSSNIKGYLTVVGDSLTIVTAPMSNKMIFRSKTENGEISINSLHAKYPTQNISIKDVQAIKFRKNSSVGTGAIVGGLFGFVIGGIIGLSTAEDESDCQFVCIAPSLKGLSGLAGGIIGIIPGAIIGGFVGSGKIKIPINGNPNFQKDELLKYTLSY